MVAVATAVMVAEVAPVVTVALAVAAALRPLMSQCSAWW